MQNILVIERLVMVKQKKKRKNGITKHLKNGKMEKDRPRYIYIVVVRAYHFLY